MIDLHSHVLPGVDDGAATMQVTMEMLDAYVACGFHTVVATPHLHGKVDPRYLERVDRAFGDVEPVAREHGITLQQGFEIQLGPETARQLADTSATLGTSGAVLVDLPFTEWPLYADSALFALQANGYRVILAHPERYPGIQTDPDKARELVEHGVALQVNIGSLSGVFGKEARRAADTLFKHSLVHLVATDAHSTGSRMAAVPAGLNRLRQLVGEGGVQQLTVTAPSLILANQPFPEPVRSLPQPWYRKITSWRSRS